MADSIFKPVIETSYLTARNVGRYRAIMRFLYEQHLRMLYWLRPADVYEGVLAQFGGARGRAPDTQFNGYHLGARPKGPQRPRCVEESHSPP